MKGKIREYIPVILISISFALLLLSNVIVTVIRQPKGTVNLLTGHYFEDYFEYLAFIKQGADGNLILHNPFNGKDTSRLVFPWASYAVTGFVFSKILGIPPVYTYWLSSFFQMVVLFILSFAGISLIYREGRKSDKLFAFLVFLISSGLFSRNPDGTISIFSFWYSNGSPVSRFGPGTLHHITANIILLGGMYWFYKIAEGRSQKYKNVVFFSISSVLLLLGPPQMVLFLGSFFLSRIFIRRFDGIVAYIAMSFLLLPLFLVYREMMKGNVYESGFLWDIRNYVYPNIAEFILAEGPIIITGILGSIFVLRKGNASVYAFFSITAITVFFALVPVHLGGRNVLAFLGMHNLRFMTPLMHIFPAVATVALFRKLSANSLIYYIIILIYFTINIISLQKIIRDHIEGPYGSSYLLYMPENMYKTVRQLEKTNKGSIVLTSPSSMLGLAVPAISGKHVYIGRSIFTDKLEERVRKADDFYSMRLDAPSAKKFLSDEKISYILISGREAGRESYLMKYPFLKEYSISGESAILENRL